MEKMLLTKGSTFLNPLKRIPTSATARSSNLLSFNNGRGFFTLSNKESFQNSQMLYLTKQINKVFGNQPVRFASTMEGNLATAAPEPIV
jgi:hypothetical protein